MNSWFSTAAGQRFTEGTMPRIANALEDMSNLEHKVNMLLEETRRNTEMTTGLLAVQLLNSNREVKQVFIDQGEFCDILALDPDKEISIAARNRLARNNLTQGQGGR